MKTDDIIFLERAYNDLIVDQNDVPIIIIDEHKVDLTTLQIKGLEADEHPFYEDAFASYAEFTSGEILTENELHELTQTSVFREFVILNGRDLLQDS